MNSSVMITCKTCRQVKKHHAKGLCARCYRDTRIERDRWIGRAHYYKRKAKKERERTVKDSLLGIGMICGEPFITDGEEMVLVKFRNNTIEWKLSELTRI